MKRIIIGVFIVLIAVPSFAINLELGPCVFLDFAVPLETLSEFDQAKHLGLEDLVLGADLEVMLGMLQLGALATFNPPAEWEVDGVTVESPGYVNLGLDAGILLQIIIVRLGIGAGPTLRVPLSSENRPEGKPVDLGINVKGNIDLDIGGIALRLNISTFLDVLEMTREDSDGLSALPVNVGLSLLFDLI